MDTIGSRIKGLREKIGYSMGKLEEAIDASRGSVNQWEKDRSIPGGKAVIALAEFFHVSTDYILLGAEINHQKSTSFFTENGELNLHLLNLAEEEKLELHSFIHYLMYKRIRTDKFKNGTNIREKEDTYLPSDKFIKLPILGNVAAGNPILAIENLDGYLEVPYSIGKGGDFILRVKGESMVDLNINDGDYVIVKKQSYAESGQIVVAAIEHEATVKTLKFDNDSYVLEPANSNYSPIKAANAIIYGVVVGVYHSS